MGQLIAELPDQCRDAWSKTRGLTFPSAYRGLKRVLVLGMGGSAIGGDLASDLQAFEGASPVTVHRDYTLPASIGEGTLVVASSYSGETEETLAAFEAALDGGARCVAITTGGRLAVLAESRRAPIVPIEIECQPRASVGWGLCAQLAVLQALGLAPQRDQDLAEAAEELDRLAAALAPTVPFPQNPAKQLATAISQRTALIVGARHLRSVASRWKTQIAENAKAWAFSDTIPEMNHNAIEALSHPEEARDQLFVVLLRSTLYSGAISRRFALTADLLKRAGVPTEDPQARSDGPLAQILTTVLLGDYVSYYLAVLRDVDPTAVPTLNWFKAQLARD